VAASFLIANFFAEDIKCVTGVYIAICNRPYTVRLIAFAEQIMLRT